MNSPKTPIEAVRYVADAGPMAPSTVKPTAHNSSRQGDGTLRATPPLVSERTLPHSLEAERSCLGAVLVHNDIFDVIAGALKAQFFYRKAHQEIWSAIVALRSVGVAVDLVTLREQLSRTGVLNDVGGPAYITSLADGVPRSTNAEYYARIVAEKAALRGVIDIANRTLTAAYVAEDPAHEIIRRADVAFLSLNGNGHGRLRSLKDTSTALFADLEHRTRHRGELQGIDTGYPSLNALTFGWLPGDLIVLAARPSVGKSSLLVNMAAAAAKTGKRVAIFSLEMRRRQLEYRILSHLSGIMMTRLQGGYTGAADGAPLAEAFQQLHDLCIYIDDRAGQTIHDIRTACRRLQAEEGLDLVGIDYVQLIPGTLDRRGATRNEELTDISRRAQTLADECHVPILLLSQLRRLDRKGGRVPKPRLEDLRECGALEQDPAIVGLLHRTNYKESGLTEFLLEKARNGPTGQVDLTFNRDTCTFTDGWTPMVTDQEA